MIRIVLFLGILWATDEARVVTAQGTGIIVRDDRAKARSEAMADALKKAVEQVVASLLTQESIEEHFDLLNDRIYSRPSSYIRGYRIPEEKEEGNRFTVTVEVQIDAVELEKDLSAVGVLLPRKQTPRAVVMVMEQNVSDQMLHSFLFQSSIPSEGLMGGSIRVTFARSEPSACETAVMDTLTEKGLTVIDLSLVVQKVGEERTLKVFSLDDTSAGRIAEVSGADVAVYGRAVARPSSSIEGSSMIAAQADISVRAVKAGSGAVIATSIGHGTAILGAAAAAGSEALKRAAIEAAEDLSGKIFAQWGSESGGKRLIDITASGVTRYALLDRLQKVLRKEIKGVKAVSLRSLSAGKAHLEVEYIGSANDLVREIVKADLGELHIVCEELPQ